MTRVQIDKQAPDFTLAAYQGDSVSLSDFKGEHNVLLVFNRGFT